MTETARKADSEISPSGTKRRWPWWKRLGTLLIFTYAGWVVMLWFLQGPLIFPAYVVPPESLLKGAPDEAELISVTTPAGEGIGWLLQPTKTSVGGQSTAPSPLAVWFHGNAEVVDHVCYSREVTLLQDLGFAVLLVEYPGYGQCPGTASQAGIVATATALYDAVISRPDVDRTRVVFFGRSLGGGAACAVAEERKPDAMVLMSTFCSVACFAHGFLVPEWLVRHPFRSDTTLGKLDIPVLIMHGGRDTIIPIQQGRALAKAAKQARFVEQAGAGHNDFPSDWAGYRREVEGFLRGARLTAR